MLKIYGHFFSAPSNKIRLTASALGIDFEYTQLDLTKGEHKSADFLKINPVGKVPAIDDEGFCLFESDAIIRYLARKVASPLYPEDNQVRSQIDQWINFSYNHILLNVGKILFNTAFAPSMGMQPNHDSIKEGNKFLGQYLPLVEKQLTENTYLLSSEISLADIALLASLEPVEFIKYDISVYPHIAKWRKELMAQDFYQKIHKHYAAELPPQA